MSEEFSVFRCVTSLQALDNGDCESEEGRWTNSLWWDCCYSLLSDMSALSVSIANMESENILLAKLIYRNFNQHRSTTVFSTLHKACKLAKMVVPKDVLRLDAQAIKHLRLMQNPKVCSRDLSSSMHFSQQLRNSVTAIAEAAHCFNKAARTLKPLLQQILFVPLYTMFLGICARSLQSLSALLIHFDSQLQALKTQIKHVAFTNQRHSSIAEAGAPSLQYSEQTRRMVVDMRTVYALKLVSAASSSSSSSSKSANASSSSGSLNQTSGVLDQGDDSDIIESNAQLREMEREINGDAMKGVDVSHSGYHGSSVADDHCYVALDNRETLSHHGHGDEDINKNKSMAGAEEYIQISSNSVANDMDMDISLLRTGTKAVGVGIGDGEGEDFGEFIGESASFFSPLRSVKKRKIIHNNDIASDESMSQRAFLFQVEEETTRKSEEPLVVICQSKPLTDPSSCTPLHEISSPSPLKKKKSVMKKQQGKVIGTEDSKKPKKIRKVKEKDDIDDIFADL